MVVWRCSRVTFWAVGAGAKAVSKRVAIPGIRIEAETSTIANTTHCRLMLDSPIVMSHRGGGVATRCGMHRAEGNAFVDGRTIETTPNRAITIYVIIQTVDRGTRSCPGTKPRVRAHLIRPIELKISLSQLHDPRVVPHPPGPALCTVCGARAATSAGWAGSTGSAAVRPAGRVGAQSTRRAKGAPGSRRVVSGKTRCAGCSAR